MAMDDGTNLGKEGQVSVATLVGDVGMTRPGGVNDNVTFSKRQEEPQLTRRL